MQKAIYMTEFKTCSCTQIHRQGDGLGYCRKHGTDKKMSIVIARPGEDHYSSTEKDADTDSGWANNG